MTKITTNNNKDEWRHANNTPLTKYDGEKMPKYPGQSCGLPARALFYQLNHWELQYTCNYMYMTKTEPWCPPSGLLGCIFHHKMLQLRNIRACCIHVMLFLNGEVCWSVWRLLHQVVA